MGHSTEVSKSHARLIIDRLRSGVPPPLAINILTVGHRDLMDKVREDLNNLRNSNCKSLIIEGKYGFGKTHILEYIAHQALNQNFAVSTVTLNKREKPLSRFDIIYKQIMDNLRIPDSPYSNGLEILLDKWSDSLNKNIPKTHNCIKHCLCAYTTTEDTTCRYSLQKVISGEPTKIKVLENIFRRSNYYEFHRPLKIKNHEYVQLLDTIINIMHQCGYFGLMLIFDETESISSNNIISRIKAYKIFEYFLKCNNTNGLYNIFAVTPKFFYDLTNDRRWIKLKEKYKDKYCKTVEFINTFFQNWYDKRYTLKQLESQEIVKSLKEIRQIHSIAFEWNAYEVVTDEILQKILRKLDDQSTRSIIKATVEILDLAEQYPDFDPLTEIELFS